MMNKEAVVAKIRDYLEHQDKIAFAIIFGSFIKGEAFRDIDIAVYSEKELELIRMGIIQAELTERTGQAIDLVSLKGLPYKDPAFAYEIVTHGEPLFYTDKKNFTDYKRKALLYYFDTARLREEVEQAFSKRLESDQYGRRKYE